MYLKYLLSIMLLISVTTKAANNVAYRESASAPKPITFFHISDTHILWAEQQQVNEDCSPSGGGRDGRTDCKNVIALYDDISQWLDPISNQSNAPIKALEDMVDYINEQNPDFVVITGDLISNGLGCDQDTQASYQKFNEIINNLNVPWYATNGEAHDGTYATECYEMYTQYVQTELNWTFTMNNSLFVGIEDNMNAMEYLNDVLNEYAYQGYKAFVFTHKAAKCYDQWYGGQYRCQNFSGFGELLQNYASQYETIIVLSGHNHANIYDDSDAQNNLHHITTSATMNYPTQARVIQITNDLVNITMTPSISPNIDELSLNLVEGIGVRDARMFFGDETDRTIYVTMSHREPAKKGVK